MRKIRLRRHMSQKEIERKRKENWKENKRSLNYFDKFKMNQNCYISPFEVVILNREGLLHLRELQRNTNQIKNLSILIAITLNFQSPLLAYYLKMDINIFKGNYLGKMIHQKDRKKKMKISHIGKKLKILKIWNFLIRIDQTILENFIYTFQKGSI